MSSESKEYKKRGIWKNKQTRICFVFFRVLHVNYVTFLIISLVLKVYEVKCSFCSLVQIKVTNVNSCRTLNSLLCLIMCWTGSGYITHLECGEAVAVWPQYRALCIKCQSSLWSSSLCEGLRLNPLNNLSQPWWRQRLHFNMATAPHSSVPHLFCIFIVTNFNVIYKSAAFQ